MNTLKTRLIVFRLYVIAFVCFRIKLAYALWPTQFMYKIAQRAHAIEWRYIVKYRG